MRKFEKMLSADGRVGVWIVKGKHESYGNEGRTRVWHLDQRRRKAGVFVKYCLCLGITQNVPFFRYDENRENDRGTWVEESGHE